MNYEARPPACPCHSRSRRGEAAAAVAAAGPVRLGPALTAATRPGVRHGTRFARAARVSADARGGGERRGTLRCGPVRAGPGRDLGPGLRSPPTIPRGTPHVRSLSKGRQGSGVPWSQTPGAFQQPLAGGQDAPGVRALLWRKQPQAHADDQPGGPAVRSVTRGPGTAVRRAQEWRDFTLE